MKKYPKKEEEIDISDERRKIDVGFMVDLYGFEDENMAMKHLSVLNNGNDYSITGVQFGIRKEGGYFIVNGFVVGALSPEQASKSVLNYLTQKISRDYVR